MININEFCKLYEDKISKDELISLIDENKIKEQEQHPDITSDELDQRSLLLTRIQLKRILTIPSSQFTGFIIADGDTVDMARIKRDRALKTYEENPEKALRENLVIEDKGEIVVIDNREFFNNNNKNPNFRKPLPELNSFRVVNGFARKNGSSEYKYFTLTLNNQHTNFEVPQFIPVKFRAKLNNKLEDEYWKLTSNAATTGFDIVITENIDYKKIILEYGFNLTTTLSNLKTFDSTDNNKLAIVEADIVSMSNNVSSKGNRMISIDDESLKIDEIIGGFIKDSLIEANNLSVTAKTILVGRPRVFTDSNTNEQKLLFNILGCYVYPEYRIDKPTPITSDSENADKNWS